MNGNGAGRGGFWQSRPRPHKESGAMRRTMIDPDIKAIWLNEVKVYFPKFFFPVPLSLCFNFLRYMC